MLNTFEGLVEENEKIARRKAKRIKKAREYIMNLETDLYVSYPELKKDESVLFRFNQMKKILENNDKEDTIYNS
ncbi:hypothetical protein [Bacillus velezensis]|uniref:hypothetical protein n=1 Tax=Bacillus velezensis TaxID=492670 RepID=UPI001A934E6F|nr:hypothetical protein [Bacillus velezensis]BCT30439.1 hypothetical protein BVAD3_41130 [Bacillus velezensis]